jgi:putative protease
LNTPPERPELLAPAGGPEVWAAAVDAGADAVYLGLKSFSARAFAANFSWTDLEQVIDRSHQRGVKIFLAFNALVKETELPDAVRAVDALARLDPDALIVQDLGLMRLIKKHFPQIETHASTLTAVHNRPGLETLAQAGFDRAVLARELTLQEVEELCRQSPVGLEMFVHGAMCLSVSGLCLMSGFLGGKGSLRGACTQPCRRAYASGRRKGRFFSPADLDAGPLMNQIRELPLKALKIEGRMKGPGHVATIVRAYRLLLDAPEEDFEAALYEAHDLIESSLGRTRSTGFLLSSSGESGLAPNLAATSGRLLGRVSASDMDGGLVRLKEPVALGDRLRVKARNTEDQRAFTLKGLRLGGQPADRAEADREAFLEASGGLAEGDLVFKVDEADTQKQALDSPLLDDWPAKKPEEAGSIQPSAAARAALKTIQTRKKTKKAVGRSDRYALWYRLGRTEELQNFRAFNPDRIILPLTRPNVKRFAAMRKRLGGLADQVIWSLPPVLYHPERVKGDLASAWKMGGRQFMAANVAHFKMLETPPARGRGRMTVYADWRLNCLNTQTENHLAELGAAGVTWSVEVDQAEFEAVSRRPAVGLRLVYLFGRPALFTTRFNVGLKNNVPVESPRSERFRFKQEGDLGLVMAEQPIFMTPALKFASAVDAFIVDLEHDPRPVHTAREITEALTRRRSIGHASRFNWKRGLF